MSKANEADKAGTIGAELVDQLDSVYTRLVERLDGIGDAEYLWEPVSGSWSVRAGEDGVYRAEKSYPDPEPAPFTTIAWRLWHIGGDCLLSYSDRFFEGKDRDVREWPGTAAGGIAALDGEWTRFRAHVTAMDDEALGSPMGPKAGRWAEHSYRALALHAMTEVIHHGAEIGLLRDLHRAQTPG
jgi:uncharacterized damage-inducible protein DinB